MRLPLAVLLILSLSAEPSGAEPPQSQDSTQLPPSQAKKEPAQDLLRNAFQIQFSPEQLAQFETPLSLEQLTQRMSPEQRQGVRAKLGELEASAKTPEDLKAVARGYLILGEHGADVGEGAVRVAERLRELEPGKSDGFALAASGFHQMGDYPTATQWAREALKLNPNDRTARTVLMLSSGRTGRGSPGMAGVPSTGGQNGDFAVSEWRIPEAGASPQALGLMRQAVAARRAGDMDKTFQLAQAAMRADPTSPGVQEFYRIADADRAQHSDTADYLRRSKEALDAGLGEQAVMWAQKAADRSRHPTAYKILELTKQRREKLAQPTGNKSPEKGKTPSNGGFPLWPIGVAVGLLGIGYGVSRGGNPSSGETENDVVPPGTVQKPGFISDPLGTVSDHAFRAKAFVEDHPYASLAVAVGAAVLAAGIAGPSLLAGGGAAALAPASAATVAAPAAGATLAQAGPAVAAGAVLLMAGELKDPSTSKDTGATPSAEPAKKSVKLGQHKSAAKWQNQMKQRGWTEEQIQEAIEQGQKFRAPNNIHPENPATRHVHPKTGRSVVVDEKTREVLQVQGDGFKNPNY